MDVAADFPVVSFLFDIPKMLRVYYGPSNAVRSRQGHPLLSGVLFGLTVPAIWRFFCKSIASYFRR